MDYADALGESIDGNCSSLILTDYAGHVLAQLFGMFIRRGPLILFLTI